MGELEPSQMRVSDADRQRVAEVLREAAGDGRIDLTELDERLEATFAAKTYAELVPITRDLQPVGPSPSRLPVGGHERERAVAIMGGVERRGAWVVPQRFSIFCLMGGADLDLRQATFAASEVEIVVNAFMGGATIVVNPMTRVVVHGVGVMGAFTGPVGRVEARLDASSPVVHVKGVALMGGVTVVRKEMPDPNKPGWRRR